MIPAESNVFPRGETRFISRENAGTVSKQGEQRGGRRRRIVEGEILYTLIIKYKQ
jgi:hypothetical protein